MADRSSSLTEANQGEGQRETLPNMAWQAGKADVKLVGKNLWNGLKTSLKISPEAVVSTMVIFLAFDTQEGMTGSKDDVGPQHSTGLKNLVFHQKQ